MSLSRLVVCLSLFAGLSAQAADFSPTRFDDPVPDGCSPADCSLREAVLAAGDAEGADRVLLSAGTYLVNYDAGSALPSGHTGPLPISSEIDIVGAARTGTLLSAGSGLQAFFVVENSDATESALALTDLSIANLAGPDAYTAVMVYETGKLNLKRVGIHDNTAALGALFSGGLLTIIDSVFERNTALVSNNGTVILAMLRATNISGSRFVDNTSPRGILTLIGITGYPTGDVSLRNNVFSNNLSTGPGAAITLSAHSGLTRVDISDSVFEDNHSGADGGAVWFGYTEDAVPTTRLEITAHGTQFNNNVADGVGGAMMLSAPDELGLLEPPSLDMDLALFSGNQSTLSGGALCTSGATSILRSTFSGNQSGGRGGAIRHDDGTLTIRQSTLSGNHAGSSGGAIYAASPVDIARSTLDGNTADLSGGGIYLSGGGESLLQYVTLRGNQVAGQLNSVRVSYGTFHTVLRFQNSIIHGGCTATSPDALADSQHNIESPGDTCELGPLNNNRNVSLAELALSPLTDNGGPTLTRLPLTGSVALDRIIAIPGCGSIDQRGYQATGGSCDVGAVEAAAVPVEPLPPEVFSDGFE